MFGGFIPGLVRVLRRNQPKIATRETNIRGGLPDFFQGGHIAFIRFFQWADADIAVAILCRSSECWRGEATDPNRWPWLLNRLRGELGFGHRVIFPLKRQGLALPQATNDFEALIRTGAALFAGNREALKLLDFISNTHTQLEPATRNHVHRGRVFSHPDRIVKRQEHHARPDMNFLGPRGNRGGNRQQRRRIAILDKMVLGQPDIVKAVLLAPYDLVDDFVVELVIGTFPGRRVAKVIPHAKANFRIAVLTHRAVLLYNRLRILWSQGENGKRTLLQLIRWRAPLRSGESWVLPPS